MYDSVEYISPSVAGSSLMPLISGHWFTQMTPLRRQVSMPAMAWSVNSRG